MTEATRARLRALLGRKFVFTVLSLGVLVALRVYMFLDVSSFQVMFLALVAAFFGTNAFQKTVENKS